MVRRFGYLGEHAGRGGGALGSSRVQKDCVAGLAVFVHPELSFELARCAGKMREENVSPLKFLFFPLLSHKGLILRFKNPE